MDKHFDSQEKWNTFLEQAKQKDTLIEQWFQTLRDASFDYFTNVDLVEHWSYTDSLIFPFQWYLTDETDQSISLLFGTYGKIALYCNKYIYNFDLVATLLQTEKYKPLTLGISFLLGTRGSGLHNGIGSRVIELEHTESLPKTKEEFAWKAGNETDLLLTEIAEKVNSIRKDESKIQLLRELMQETKLKERIDINLRIQNKGETEFVEHSFSIASEDDFNQIINSISKKGDVVSTFDVIKANLLLKLYDERLNCSKTDFDKIIEYITVIENDFLEKKDFCNENRITEELIPRYFHHEPTVNAINKELDKEQNKVKWIKGFFECFYMLLPQHYY